MRGVGWIHVQRPVFTPVVFYNAAGRTLYMPVSAFQPTIPQQPSIYHVVLDNNLLTL